MNRSRFLSGLFAVSFLSVHSISAFAADPKKPAVLTVESAKSEILWKGTKKVAGGHNGKIGVKSGTVEMGPKSVKAGELVIDMKTLECLDIPTDTEDNKKNNGKLVGHLTSPDFFDVEKFPEAKIQITGGKDLGAGKHELKGKLTIKDTTVDITFPATVKQENGETIASGKITVDRTKYGVKYGSGNFFKLAADKIINDNFDLEFKVVAN